MTKTIRIIEDVNFGSFVKELMEAVKLHPKCILTYVGCGDDKRTGSFTFGVKIEY